MGILGQVSTLDSVKVTAICTLGKKSIVIRSRGIFWLCTSAGPICTLIIGLMALVAGFSPLVAADKAIIPAAILGVFLTVGSILILASRDPNPEVYILNRSDKSITRRLKLFGMKWESNIPNDDLSGLAIACYPNGQDGYHFYSLVIIKKDGSQLNLTGKFWEKQLHALKSLATKASQALGIEYFKTDESVYHLQVECSDHEKPKIFFDPAA